MSASGLAPRAPACHVRSAQRACVRPVSLSPARNSTKCHAIELDWSDSDTWVGLAAVVLGLGVGIGAPIFYTSRIDEDEKNLEDLRKLNRETYKETGAYLTDVRSCFVLSSHAVCIQAGRPIVPARLNGGTKPECPTSTCLQEEIAAIRTPKWTDRREFVDDD